MKYIFWGKGARSTSCLEVLHGLKADIAMVVAENSDSFIEAAEKMGYRVERPENPHDQNFLAKIKKTGADYFLLAGYGKILKPEILEIPKKMSLNFHAGKLPKYRGSSPMNWALINGDEDFTLSIIEVHKGIDTGHIVLEKTFPIEPTWTIKEMHELANKQFANMLAELYPQLEKGTVNSVPQDSTKASYYPLRFPEDGLILWDQLTALEIHNRIRALTDPYPCAFTFLEGKKVLLLRSELDETDFFGSPGRVYKHSGDKILVCAKDKGLWILAARFAETQNPVFENVKRYDNFLTVSRWIIQSLT